VGMVRVSRAVAVVSVGDCLRLAGTTSIT
jgi:hypothetical protein